MKIASLFLVLLVSSQTQAYLTDGDLDQEDCEREPGACTMYTTTSMPTLIVDSVSGEEVWNPLNEELLAQYRAELNGGEPYAIKRYADVRTNGDIEAAKEEIRQHLKALENL